MKRQSRGSDSAYDPISYIFRVGLGDSTHFSDTNFREGRHRLVSQTWGTELYQILGGHTSGCQIRCFFRNVSSSKSKISTYPCEKEL